MTLSKNTTTITHTPHPASLIQIKPQTHSRVGIGRGVGRRRNQRRIDNLIEKGAQRERSAQRVIGREAEAGGFQSTGGLRETVFYFADERVGVFVRNINANIQVVVKFGQWLVALLRLDHAGGTRTAATGSCGIGAETDNAVKIGPAVTQPENDIVVAGFHNLVRCNIEIKRTCAVDTEIERHVVIQHAARFNERTETFDKVHGRNIVWRRRNGRT